MKLTIMQICDIINEEAEKYKPSKNRVNFANGLKCLYYKYSDSEVDLYDLKDLIRCQFNLAQTTLKLEKI